MVKSDTIYTIDAGKVVEKGTHKEILDKEGIYANLYNTQKQLEIYGKEVMV